MKELTEKMSKMLGKFDWEDKDHDGKVNFVEFADIMDKIDPAIRYNAISWSRQCLAPDGILKL